MNRICVAVSHFIDEVKKHVNIQYLNARVGYEGWLDQPLCLVEHSSSGLRRPDATTEIQNLMFLGTSLFTLFLRIEPVLRYYGEMLDVVPPPRDTWVSNSSAHPFFLRLLLTSFWSTLPHQVRLGIRFRS